MKVVKVAVAHEFTFREDGRLVRVSGPPLDITGGWERVMADDPDGEVLRQWDDGVALSQIDRAGE